MQPHVEHKNLDLEQFSRAICGIVEVCRMYTAQSESQSTYSSDHSPHVQLWVQQSLLLATRVLMQGATTGEFGFLQMQCQLQLAVIP